jgi:hypothetical protein
MATPDEFINLMKEEKEDGSYRLLQRYEREASTTAIAYKLSEAHWRSSYKMLQYPLIFITALASVFASVDINKYVLMALSFTSMILSSFITVINPKEKEQKANQISTEFREIASNITQFITENGKSPAELKSFSQHQLDLIDIWTSLAPPINKSYVKDARLQLSPRA